MKQILLPILFCLGFTAPVLAEDVSPIPRLPALVETISVSGLGKVTLTPDRVIFTVGVQTTAPTVEDAVNQNNAKIAKVIAALKNAKATDEEIRTSNFSIYPQQEYKEGQAPRVTGYQVSNDVTVTRDQVGDAGKLLQAAISAGVNQASGLTFTVSDQTRGRDAALKKAFDDARAKAEVLAQAAQRSLGRAISITEGTAPQTPPQPMLRTMAVMESKVSDVPVSQGTEELSFTVSVIFELR
ncbi:MAG: SIMPL domain-containing protein [Gammaproteobacteria bacterium]